MHFEERKAEGRSLLFVRLGVDRYVGVQAYGELVGHYVCVFELKSSSPIRLCSVYSESCAQACSTGCRHADPSTSQTCRVRFAKRKHLQFVCECGDHTVGFQGACHHHNIKNATSISEKSLRKKVTKDQITKDSVPYSVMAARLDKLDRPLWSIVCPALTVTPKCARCRHFDVVAAPPNSTIGKLVFCRPCLVFEIQAIRFKTGATADSGSREWQKRLEVGQLQAVPIAVLNAQPELSFAPGQDVVDLRKIVKPVFGL